MALARYLLRRALFATLLVLAASSAAVVVTLLAPGDFATDEMLGQSAEALARRRHALGLDRPLAVQYADWMGRAVRFDFGHSLLYSRPVTELVGARALNTAVLAGAALVTAGLAFLAVLAPTPSAAGGGEPRPLVPARFVPGPCPTTPEPVPGRCGFLEVPENRARRGGRTVRLTVAIVPAASGRPAADPVVFMTGGPGADAISDIPFLIDSGVNRDRDLVVMAQRGTLHSRPNLACPEVDRFYAEAVGLRYDAPSTGRRLVRATRACRGRLTASGVDLSAYNTFGRAARTR